MDRLIFIDATMREESRTRRIARPIIAELGKRYAIETISLDGAGFPAVGSKILYCMKGTTATYPRNTPRCQEE